MGGESKVVWRLQGRLVSGKLPCMELQISISGYISTQNIAFPGFLNVLICIEVL